jgi:hypothetical protein
MPNINKKPGKNRVYGPQPGGPGYVSKPGQTKRHVKTGKPKRNVGSTGNVYRKTASTTKKRAR